MQHLHPALAGQLHLQQMFDKQQQQFNSAADVTFSKLHMS
jgi:hypothetical protein